METTELKPPIDFFPLKEPRAGQVKALDFFKRAVDEGYSDIVIAAPTGFGKSVVGASVCYWGAQAGISDGCSPGGYYLVTQKLLQDQLERDIDSSVSMRGASLKSAAEYPCQKHRTCNIGLAAKSKCQALKDNACAYLSAKSNFLSSPFAITNYAYFLTERVFVNKMPARTLLVADECHTLEGQLTRFAEMAVSNKLLQELMIPNVNGVIETEDIMEFCNWIARCLLPAINSRIVDLRESLDEGLELSQAQNKELSQLTSLASRFSNSIADIKKDRDNWVYWQEGDGRGGLTAVARPIEASKYTHLIRSMASIRLYMSAYPGPKEAFCRSLGLDTDDVAWLNLKSTFPPENRPIVMGMIGSMGRQKVEKTMPGMLRVVEKVMDKHATEKGLIHCNSYQIGQAIFDKLSTTQHASRLLYPKASEARTSAYLQHSQSKLPTVLISPSMTEGFDFNEDMARWQIITKMPYPYLGDKQVAAKKERDPDWYAMKTIMTIIQAAGRICRSETDHGITYILDSDFQNLWERHRDFFPKWFVEAIVW